MHKIIVKLQCINNYSYPIYIGYDLFKDFVGFLKKHYTGNQIVLISDNKITKLYTNRLNNELKSAGYSLLTLETKAGEKSKNSKTKEKLELQMFENKVNRNALVIAFGGGVIGDLVGYTASTYMRGVKYIQVPTTLLSMIDSSVGGKTAINTKYGKNLVGTFYQPTLVFMDLNLLDSLPKKQLINGLIEAIKIFLTFDSKSFEYVAKNIKAILAYDRYVLQCIVEKAVALKAYVVENDEREENLRMSLNFGHTVGHAIERISQYKILHGIAVGIGIIIEAKIAVNLGKLSLDNLKIIEETMNKLGVSTKLLSRYDINEITNATLLDKKNKSANIVKCILLSEIGQIAYCDDKVATDVSVADILRALK
ncbi:MAG: 3-dehydroquinate synthase [Neisseriaceae bacterium]